MRTSRTAVAVIAGATALLVGGGTALAHRGGGEERGEQCETRFERIAEARGLTIAQLEARIEARLLARIDTALVAGRISSEQAARLRLRIQSGNPCSGARHAVRYGMRRMMGSAADYLDLTRAELRAQLAGNSLAALAQKQGKTVAGLKAAMLAPAKARLARAVAAGRITQAQASKRLARLESLVDRLAVKTFPAR
jgi:hypothetical protein